MSSDTPATSATFFPRLSFVTMYARESFAAHVTPVFTLYTIRQSLPGRDVGDEAKADLGNLANVSTMRDWYANARLLFKLAGAPPQSAKEQNKTSIPAEESHELLVRTRRS